MPLTQLFQYSVSTPQYIVKYLKYTVSTLHILGFSRDDFPPDFVFGAGTSAYQYEGAVDVDGKRPSIWDTFTHAGKVADKSTADVTAGGYYKYRMAEEQSTLKALSTTTMLSMSSSSMAKQNGWIGMNVYTFWMVPFTDSTADITATQRAFDFQIGWVINPLVFGDYPETMKKRAGSRIPTFTKCQSKKLMKSFDFIGINHYTTIYISDNIDDSNTGLRDYYEDMSVVTSVSRNETPSGQFIPVAPLPPDPNGIRKMLEYLKDFYNNPPVYVQENGLGTPYNDTNLNDTERVDFLRGYIGAILEAIRPLVMDESDETASDTELG
ncbi:Beta-glucosidase 22 [Acorus gramineus]|uniref:Beta-glucosidase 22 n=1 Tax=Acorus gramineus TaxID=55184 RepID=A0AAV9BWR9_ACOGR|nr:Beta-glucosidase 22 [Acorus gramineus]